ncbi:MAG TPA: PaaI family thioesterase [Mycobacteriales bacterium]|nr:PaaI family thioesterase [Mycobacteriales bacterium]
MTAQPAEGDDVPVDDVIRQDGWFPTFRDPSPKQERKGELADELRALIAGVLWLDSDECDDDALRDVRALLRSARERIDALPDVGPKGGLFGSPEDFSLYQRSPFSGRANALATPLTVWADGDRIRAHATYGAAYEGPPGSVHGGHVMAAFDDLLGVGQAASGTAGFTGTLTVRMVSRTPLHTRIDYEAWVDRREGRKVFMAGEAHADGDLLASAEGTFIAPRTGLHLPVPDHFR